MLRQWAKKPIERFYRRKKFQITLTRKLTSNQLIEDQTDQEYQQLLQEVATGYDRALTCLFS